MDARLRHRRWGVTGVAMVAAVVAAAASPSRQDLRHLDHIAFLEAVRRVRAGEGVYEAFTHGMQHIGASVDQVRAVRQPWVFALWGAVPEDVLRWSFFLVVAFATAVLMARLTRHPEIGLAGGAWVAIVGVYGGRDAWLLPELWAAPLVLACCLAWLGEHDWLAAALALACMLLRETAVLLPLGFLVGAWWQRRPLKPWFVSFAVAAVALGLHWTWAQPYLDPEGRSATLIGTGGPGGLVAMTSILGFSPRFTLASDVVGLVIWAVGIVLLWRSALRPALPLALIPLLGLVVNRPYWGFLAMPLAIVALGGLPPWAGRGSPVDAEPAPADAGVSP